MALRQRGKHNYYHCYYRTVRKNSNGELQYTTTTVNLGTTDLKLAKALEAELLKKNRNIKSYQMAKAREANLAILAGERPADETPKAITHAHRKKRLKLSDVLETAKKYREVGDTSRKIFNAFCKNTSYKYVDEITPEIAFDYLALKYPNSEKGKAYNNTRSSLNSIFTMILLDAGVKDSPFERIPFRRNNSDHQRPFSEEEFIQIYTNAPEPWRSASLIAWYTGLRQKDIFLLKWEQIKDDVITTTPAKTARFGRAVQIPLHAELLRALSDLPRVGERVLGAWSYEPKSSDFKSVFSDLLKTLNITSNERGIVVFNSLRDSFVTRCDELGIPRHALRGIVGHVSDNQTDLYSHDLETAKEIKKLSNLKLPKQAKTQTKPRKSCQNVCQAKI